MSSFLRYYMPGPPTATPGARSLSEALRGISEDRMQREQMAAQAEQQRLMRENQGALQRAQQTFTHEENQARIKAEAARADAQRMEQDRRDLRQRRWTVRDKIQGAMMGMDPEAMVSLAPAAKEVGIDIARPAVPEVGPRPATPGTLALDPVTGELTRRMPGGDEQMAPDFQIQEDTRAYVDEMRAFKEREKAAGDAKARADAGVVEIREGDAVETYDPREVAAASARNASRLEGIADKAEVPGGRIDQVEQRRKEVFAARVPVYRQMGLADAEAIAKAQTDANQAANALQDDIAAGKKAFAQPPDRPRYTDNSVRAYANGVATEFRTPKAREAMQQANEAIQLINGVKRTGLKDRVALGRIRKALFGAQQSDREGAYVMNSGGLQTRLENAIKALDNGQWSDQFANDILDLSHEIAVANERHITRARDALVDRLGTSTDPNIQGLDHTQVANGYFGIGGRRQPAGGQPAQKPAAGGAPSMDDIRARVKAQKAKKK